jgi:hypothetical protein
MDWWARQDYSPLCGSPSGPASGDAVLSHRCAMLESNLEVLVLGMDEPD